MHRSYQGSTDHSPPPTNISGGADPRVDEDWMFKYLGVHIQSNLDGFQNSVLALEKAMGRLSRLENMPPPPGHYCESYQLHSTLGPVIYHAHYCMAYGPTRKIRQSSKSGAAKP